MTKRNGFANYVAVLDPCDGWVILPRSQCMALIAGKWARPEWAGQSLKVVFAEIAFVDGARELLSLHSRRWHFLKDGALDRKAFAASLAGRMALGDAEVAPSSDDAQLTSADLLAIGKILHVEVPALPKDA